MAEIPDDRKYTRDHEWVVLGSTARIGITEYAAEALGDVVFLDLPAVGQLLQAGSPFGEIESTKSISELIAPVDGRVVAVNAAVVDDPALVNVDPYGAGWLVEIAEVARPAELLDGPAYRQLIES